MPVKKTGGGTAKLLKRLSAARDKRVDVGIVGKDASAVHRGGADLPVGAIGVLHEFGFTHPSGVQVPARSFIRVPLDAAKGKIRRVLRVESGKVLSGKQTVERALERVGLVAQGIVQGALADGVTPGLKQSTIDRKGSSKPLIDTGQLRSAVSSQVRGRRE